MVSFRKKKAAKAPDAPSPAADGTADGAEDAADAAPAPAAAETGPPDAARAPAAPMAPAPLPARPPRLDDIPDLLAALAGAPGLRSAAATKRLYELCDVGHKQNRVPMVRHAGPHDVLAPLARCLARERGDARHLACLALNNLSIPTENKRVMALGPSAAEVLDGLCRVLAEDRQESYLCCICLMNLSFLEACVVTLLEHSPAPPDAPDGTAAPPPLDNPASLLRTLERLLERAPAAPGANAGAARREGVRWACGLIKNLARAEENAALFGRTAVAACVVRHLRDAAAPPPRWTSNSLEDFSLFVVLHLAQWPASRRALVEAGAVAVVRPLMADAAGDLQGLKAAMACAFLGAPWADFPKGGAPAAKAVAELLTNILEKRGKDGQYAHGAFQLHTAARAYRDLCRAARAADGPDAAAAPRHAKVLAVPSAVALCLQVVSDRVPAAAAAPGAAAPGAPDARAAEHAAAAVADLLPALLQAGEPPRRSGQSERACGEISTMLARYAALGDTAAAGREAARTAAEEIGAAGGSARPILEISHELWTQYRKRQGQPLDQFLGQEKGIEVDESGPMDFLPCVNVEGQCVIY